MFFNWIIEKIAWDYNQRQINKILPLISKINEFYVAWDSLTDEQIKQKTQEFKNAIQSWTSLDEILPQAFATVKQACKRLQWSIVNLKWQEITWDMIPYDVQLIWWIVLHQWKISEMKTWEWKTLVATLPMYLNALSWKWVHLVTVNDYLTSRDAQWMSHVFNWLWLSVWIVTKETSLSTRRAEYEKDITYVENSELWFDYLRDNLARTTSERNLIRRPLNFAIVDEVDSILIDEARTPLIISQASAEATDKYWYYAQIVKLLKPCKWKKKVNKWLLNELFNEADWKNEIDDGDYYIDEKHKNASLSSNWIQKLEWILKVNNLYKDLGYEEIHHIENALKANAVYIKDKDYILRNGEVMIVDEHTWRVMPWRRYSEGLHQAIEAKENVQVQRESQTLATITYQHFFKQYKKLAWMTWTATTEWEEFEKIYDLEVIAIPTNKNILRVDKNDKVYFNQNAKRQSVTDNIRFYHQMWLPLLIWTSSIETSEFVSWLLRNVNIQHYVLNAKYHEQEANIIANAWKLGSVVVATNMAWRWTDIKLEKWLNEKISQNYVNWIKLQLKWDTFTKTTPKWVSAVVCSENEFDLLIQSLQQWFWLNDEDIRNAEKWWLSKQESNIEIKIIFNKSKKNKDQWFAEIIIKNLWEKEPEIIEKDFHFGLFILWTEKHDSRRIDNQLRWRAWRQWDPGISQFYVALDDEIMRKMWWEKIQAIAKMLLPKNELESIELTQKQFTSSIQRAQKQMEWWYFGIRKHLFDYDSVINKQRQRVYAKRDEIIFSFDKAQQGETEYNVYNEIKTFIHEVIKTYVDTYTNIQPWNYEEIIINIQQVFWIDFLISDINKFTSQTDLLDYLELRLNEYIENKFNNIDNQDTAKQIMKNYYLETIDRHWIKHIDDLQYLREKVSLYGYAQEDPLVMYKKQWFDKFQKLLFNIKQESVSFLFKYDFGMNQWQSFQWYENMVPTMDQIHMPDANIQSWNWLLGALKDVVKNIKPQDIQEIQNMMNQVNQTSSNTEIVELGSKKAKVLEKSDDIEVLEINSKEDDNVNIQINKWEKIRPNDLCNCGSWKKYKKCCWK